MSSSNSSTISIPAPADTAISTASTLDDNNNNNNNNEIPDEFLCPITQQLFRDPVMDMQGHTYERNAILSWLGANGTCPMSRRPMKASDLIPNVMMQTRVRLWQRETGRKVTPLKSWDNMEEVLAYYDQEEGSTEAESSGSDGETDNNNNNFDYCYHLNSPTYAVTFDFNGSAASAATATGSSSSSSRNATRENGRSRRQRREEEERLTGPRSSRRRNQQRNNNNDSNEGNAVVEDASASPTEGSNRLKFRLFKRRGSLSA